MPQTIARQHCTAKKDEGSITPMNKGHALVSGAIGGLGTAITQALCAAAIPVIGPPPLVFPVSDGAGSITGQTFHVNGRLYFPG